MFFGFEIGKLMVLFSTFYLKAWFEVHCQYMRADFLRSHFSAQPPSKHYVVHFSLLMSTLNMQTKIKTIKNDQEMPVL